MRAFCQSSVWDNPSTLFINAGWPHCTNRISSDEQHDTIRSQLFGTMVITRRAMEHFRQRGRGRLMVNTSIGGRMAFPYFGYYNATKHALEASMSTLVRMSRFRYPNQNNRARIHQTNFATHGMQMSGETSPYHVNGLSWLAQSMRDGTTATPPTEIAPVIVSALFDNKHTLRYHQESTVAACCYCETVTRQLFRHHLSSSPTRTKIDVSLRPRGQLFS